MLGFHVPCCNKKKAIGVAVALAGFTVNVDMCMFINIYIHVKIC